MTEENKQNQKLSKDDFIKKYSEIQTLLKTQSSPTSGNIIYIHQDNGHLTVNT